jgi:DNA/RNA endonuclease YhcR with UshA esterase domain
VNVIEVNGQLQFTVDPLADASSPQDDTTDPDPTDETTDTDEETNEPTLVPGRPGSVLVNEFVSDPITGEDEWVELFNPGSSDIDLTDWAIIEGAGRRTSLEGYIEAGGFAVITSPRGSLNNGGDLIELQDSFGNTIDLIAYGNWTGATAPVASDPASVGRDPNMTDTFEEMDPTPGAVNVFDSGVHIALDDPTDDTDTTDADPTIDAPTTNEEPTDSQTSCDQPHDEPATDSDASDDLVFIDLANIRTLPLETMVSTEGIVSSVPGALGKQVFYLAGSGVQVYLHSAEFPVLDRGMHVRVTGELRESSGETRVLLSDASDIEILGITDAPTPHDMTTAEVGEATEGWLVRVTGMVAERTSSSFMLEDDLGQARVFIKSTTGIANTVSVGDEVTVTGVVSQTSSGYRLLPRTQDDILPRTETADTDNEIIALGLTKSGAGTLGGWILSTLVALALLSFGGAYAYKKKNVWNKKPLTA